MGKSSDKRPRSDSFSSVTGSGRSGAGAHFAWEVRGTRPRKALPAVMRSSTVGPSESSRELGRALLMLTTVAGAFAVFAASAFFISIRILYQKIRKSKSGDSGLGPLRGPKSKIYCRLEWGAVVC